MNLKRAVYQPIGNGFVRIAANVRADIKPNIYRETYSSK